MRSALQRALATAFGLLMAAAAALQADAVALGAALGAAALVLASVRWPGAATLAVAACVVAIATSDPHALLAALCGLNATCYLALRHVPVTEAVTGASLIGVLGLSSVGLAAAAVPAGLPWVPLAAAPAVVVAFAIAIRPIAERPAGADRHG